MGVNSWITIFTKLIIQRYPHLKQGNTHIVFTPALDSSSISTAMSKTYLNKYNNNLIVRAVHFYLITLSMYTGLPVFGQALEFSGQEFYFIPTFHNQIFT